jgi:hypothetical protein
MPRPDCGQSIRRSHYSGHPTGELGIGKNWEGKKAAAKGTPAMRLGLAKAPFDLSDIIYYR